MIKLAVLISGGDLSCRRGLIDAALTRVEHLQNDPCYGIDLYAIKAEYKLFHLSLGGCNKRFINDIQFDNHVIHVLSKVEYYSNNKYLNKFFKFYYRVRKHRLSDWEWHKKFAQYFSNYDAIIAHFIDAAVIASSVYEYFNIPYFVTWHGSDIHSIPISDFLAREKVITAIENASYNFFVSHALLVASNKLTRNGKKMVLYNGVDSIFYRFPENCRKKLKVQYGLREEKVVCFVGNLRPVKNADLLPYIFYQVKQNYHGDVKFWIIGNGELREIIESKSSELSIDCVFWGAQTKLSMPSFYNCMDVLVVPSRNEGMPLVTIEALACGVNVVGSNVGGIAESIGKDYCVDLSESFIQEISMKISDILTGPSAQPLPSVFSWSHTFEIENYIYKSTIL